MHKYKSLKDGWITLVDFAQKHGMNEYKRNLLIIKLGDEYKEQIGRTWVIVEEEAEKIL